MRKTSLFLLIGFSLAALLVGCVDGPIYKSGEHDGETSTNFNGEVFVNREPMSKSPLDMMRLSLGVITQAESWPALIENTPADIPAARVYEGIRVTYVNHATVLIQVAGLNILTDPIYSERASPFSFAGPKRIRAPGVKLEDLPPIDVILISHNHYDHLDTETLKNLASQQSTEPLVLAGLGVGKLLSEIGLKKTVDMQWDQVEVLEQFEFVFVECRHRSGRGISDQMKTLWGSFVIKTPEGNIYFAGDTGYGPHLKEHGEQFGPYALSILPIGAYEPRWFMADVHLNPEEAVQAHIDLNSKQSLSIHFGVFQLTYEAVDQPEQDLAAALLKAKIDMEAFWTLLPGEAKSLSGASLDDSERNSR
tara:strand:+ start:3052 stop:4143 length:1092 start_codon:yes stop_codon:yes gene_type:complete